MLHVSHVTLAEFFKPEPHPLAGQDGLFQLFFQNAGVQSFFPGFQFVQPLLGGRGQDALFNGFQKVCQPLLCIPELVFQNRQSGVLLLLGFHNQIYQLFDDFIAENHLNGSLHHEPFQRLFADSFQVAVRLAVAFGVAALVVIVGVSHVAGAALAAHQGAALAAEQLGGKQIVDICLVVGRCLTVNLAPALDRIETLRVDDGRYSIRDDGILISVFAQIPAVLEQRLEAVLGEPVAPAVADAPGVQRFDDAANALPCRVPLERFLHHRCGGWVDLIVMLAVDAIAQRHRTAVELGFEGVLLVAAADLLSQLRRIVLGHSFQQAFQHDAFRRVGDGFRHRHHMDPVVFEDALIMGRIVPVAGKAVQFPHQYRLKGVGGAVVDHLLELRAAVGLGGQCPVNVGPHHSDAVLVGILLAFPQLAFDGFLPLVVAAVTGIDHGIHGVHLLTCASPLLPY